MFRFMRGIDYCWPSIFLTQLEERESAAPQRSSASSINRFGKKTTSGVLSYRTAWINRAAVCSTPSGEGATQHPRLMSLAHLDHDRVAAQTQHQPLALCDQTH